MDKITLISRCITKNLKPENKPENKLCPINVTFTVCLDFGPAHPHLRAHTHTPVTDVIATGFCFNPCRHLQRQIRGLVMKRQR